MARVRLVHGDGRDAVEAVRGEPLLNVLKRGSIRREGHEEMPRESRPERRRLRVRGDGENGPLERR